VKRREVVDDDDVSPAGERREVGGREQEPGAYGGERQRELLPGLSGLVGERGG
jgi:hypothetical protein